MSVPKVQKMKATSLVYIRKETLLPLTHRSAVIPFVDVHRLHHRYHLELPPIVWPSGCTVHPVFVRLHYFTPLHDAQLL
jgi:hypothetical protein